MEALGHNSDALTQFFNEGKNFDDLAEDREWPKDLLRRTPRTLQGTTRPSALGFATMGAAYDAYPPGLHRDADTALVAEKIVARYGQLAECTDEQRTQLTGAELTKKQDGAQDSLG